MTSVRASDDLGTHRVSNQPAPRGDRDLWADDPWLAAAVRAAGAGPHEARLAAYGATLGAEETREDGRLANRFSPELKLFDAGGRRLDEVAFHPAYHAMMARGISAGYADIAWSWRDRALESRPGGHVAHAAMVYMASQVEPGACCPMTMSYAAVPALAADADLAAEWIPRLLSGVYDEGSKPAAEKRGATIGMAMTEKQGGSDVRANETRATPDGADWRLTGHKWFCSAPMSDAFLTLAQAPGGLTCFLAPRWTRDGQRNAIRLMRLKDKLGNRANASAEIEYAGAEARRLGAEGDGVRTILSMVRHTRLDTAMAPAGLMRAALDEALWWCRARSAFQKRLIDQPLMRSVLADLALEVEGALRLALRVAAAFDAGGDDPSEQAFARIAVAIAKFWSNKRCVWMIGEAIEALGGVGYVEESPLPLLYREAPLNGIWEGSGNIICLDVLRTLARAPDAADALREDLEGARGADRRYDAALEVHKARWPNGATEQEARWFVESLARLLQAAQMLRCAAPEVADLFIATRLGEARGACFGALPGDLDVNAVLRRL